MTTIVKVCRKSGDAYKAVIRLRGVKPFSKTFRLKKHAKTWAERMERDLDEARAHGNRAMRYMTLAELIKGKVQKNPGKDKSAISNLNWWAREYGSMELLDFDRSVIREAMSKLMEGTLLEAMAKENQNRLGGKGHRLLLIDTRQRYWVTDS
jgi:hypothetical protein